MKIISFLLCFLIAPFIGERELHEFHVSQCVIDYNTNENALQITLHIYLDDLELSMQNQGADELFLCTEKETPEAEGLLFQYLQKNFKININDLPSTSYQWIGKEISEDLAAVWCYIEITDVQEFKSLDIESTIIMDVHADQKNIVQVKGGSKSGYFMLTKGKEKETLKF